MVLLLAVVMVAAFAALAVAHLVFYKLHWIVRYASITKWMTLSIFPFRVVLLSPVSCLLPSLVSFSLRLWLHAIQPEAHPSTHTHILFYWTHTEQVFSSNFSPIYRTSLLFWLLISVSKSLWVSVCVRVCEFVFELRDILQQRVEKTWKKMKKEENWSETRSHLAFYILCPALLLLLLLSSMS